VLCPVRSLFPVVYSPGVYPVIVVMIARRSKDVNPLIWPERSYLESGSCGTLPKAYGPVNEPDRAVRVFEVAFGGLRERVLTVEA